MKGNCVICIGYFDRFLLVEVQYLCAIVCSGFWPCVRYWNVFILIFSGIREEAEEEEEKEKRKSLYCGFKIVSDQAVYLIMFSPSED